MSSTVQQIEQDAMQLPQHERIELIYRLLNLVIQPVDQTNSLEIIEEQPSNPFLSMAGMFSGIQQKTEELHVRIPRTEHMLVQKDSGNPWLELAGMFSGGPGDSAERVEEIIMSEIDSSSGLTTQP